MRTTLAILVVLVALVALGPQAQAVTTRGTGTANLMKSDLTDPNNNINDNVPGNPPYYGTGYDFLSANASAELWFSPGKGSEAALDLFDNKVGSGANKWCCNAVPTAAQDINNLAIGQWVSVTFGTQYVLTHFTISSDNDSGINRDPDQWRILGSSDGTTWTPIFTYDKNGDSPFDDFGGSADNRVLLYNGGGVDFSTPAAYTSFRFQAFSVGSAGALGLSELEYFGVTVPQLTATPPSGSTIDFGEFFLSQTGSEQFALENTGTLNSTITVTSAALSGADAAFFNLPVSPVGTVLLGQGGPASFGVDFLGSPDAGRAFDATLTMGTLDGEGGVGSVVYRLAAQTLPEPATLSLLGLGALALVRRRRRG